MFFWEGRAIARKGSIGKARNIYFTLTNQAHRLASPIKLLINHKAKLKNYCIKERYCKNW